MKMRYVISSLAALALMATLITAELPYYFPAAYAEEFDTGETKEVKELTVPQNVRVENGFLKWDEVEGAYGYNVSTTDRDGNEISVVYYETFVEVNRFIYERITYAQYIDFGEHEFKVCAFDESKKPTEYSETVTVAYDPNFEIPTNVRLSEDGKLILWDEVSGAARYNFRIYQDDEKRTLRVSYSLNSNSFDTTSNWIVENGNYLVSFQAMDKDYNVSEWTEPVSYSYTVPESLEAPKNVRLDDSGENILWDAVDGAAAYNVYIWVSFTDNSDGSSSGSTSGQRVEDTHFDNWKSYVCPFADTERDIAVEAVNGSITSPWTQIHVDYEMERDESIALPEKLVFENDNLRWEGNIIDGAKYWVRMPYNKSFMDTEWKSFDSSYTWFNIGNNEYPAGSHEVELYVVDQNYNYNSKVYSFTSEALQDETVWIPKLYYKFDTLIWDYDRLRHDETSFFWVRIKKDDNIVKLIKTSYEEFYGLSDLENGDYAVDVCVYENCNSKDKLGPWSEPLNIKKHGESLFDKENEVTESVEAPPEAADIPKEDRITSITINPAFNMKDKHDNNVELDLSKIKIKAKEIYDEEGLKRASEALGEELKGNKHYNLLDLTLLYNGEDYSNGYEGLVQVIIPIPKGHRDKTFSCYRLTEVDGKMVKEVIEGEQTEDSYIIYLEHFSEYALVGAGEDDDTVTTTPAADFYKINLKTDGHGKASANVENLAEVEAGTEVTLTATPNSGYKFSKWTVVNGGVTISNNKFTMPENDVEIKADFTKTSSGGSGGSYGGSYRPSSSGSTTETVTVNGKTGTWSDVTSAIEAAANGATITVSGSTYIPADVIAAAAKKNVKLEIRANDTFTWVLDSAKMGEGSKTLSVSDVVVAAVNKTIRSSEASKDFRVTESGLGTDSSLRYNAGKENSGRFANLFRVNGSELEFVTAVKIDATGSALLPITAAGAYKIVISDETKLVGDLDNSMGLSALDAAMMLKKLVNRDISDDETAKFDYNCDGRADAIDAAAVLKWCVNN